MVCSRTPLVKGNVYEMARKCGKRSCPCTRGRLHRTWVLSWSERPQLAQRAADGCGRMSHKGRVAVSQPVGRLAATLRQSDVAGSFQLQKQRAGGHILDAAACVAPVPPVAKLFAEPRFFPSRDVQS